MILKELEEKFVTTEKRKELFVALCDEIAYLQQYATDLPLVIFGSFLTDKQEPNDIDILMAAALNEVGVNLAFTRGMKLPIKNYPKIQIVSILAFSRKAMATTDMLIKEFDNSPSNQEKNIRITEWIELNI